MEYWTPEDETHIIIEPDEEEKLVLRIIVQTTFELAQPDGLSWVSYKPDHKLTDKEADNFISHPRSYDGRVVHIDWVEGRNCCTDIFLRGLRYYVLDFKWFFRFRGSPNEMLELSKQKIADLLHT
jgi:hypothetical protein